jgi:hypothetical protein
MFWSTVNIQILNRQFLPTFLRHRRTIAFFEALISPMQNIADETLYKMQHNGTKIYLEKVLNESYQVPGYNPNDHEGTKLIYIDDVPEDAKLFIWQNEEPDSSFLEDDGDDNPDDIFLDGDTESGLGYSWTVFMPDTISFQEYALRALIDSYRYLGKKYNVEIYTP